MADELPLPLEIPWRLASTTLPLRGRGRIERRSLFARARRRGSWRPPPDEQLVYLKFTASILPASFPESRIASMFLGEGVPCFHLRLDLRVRNAAGDLGTIGRTSTQQSRSTAR